MRSAHSVFHFKNDNMSRMICFTCLLVVVSGFERGALSSLRKRSAAGELVFPAKELNHSGVNVPAFVMGLYRRHTKDDESAEKNPQRISVTVHSIVGQGNVGFTLLDSRLIVSGKFKSCIKAILLLVPTGSDQKFQKCSFQAKYSVKHVARCLLIKIAEINDF